MERDCFLIQKYQHQVLDREEKVQKYSKEAKIVGAVKKRVKSRAVWLYLPVFTDSIRSFPYSIYLRATSVAASLKKEKSKVSPLVPAAIDLIISCINIILAVIKRVF